MNFQEILAKALLPLLGQYADKSLPEAPKRWLYCQLAQLGTEGRAWLEKTQTALDDAAFEVLVAEAVNEFAECGLFAEGTFEALDKFVEFKVE